MPDRTILLVDDSEDDVELTLRAMQRQNLANSIVVARDGEEALRLLHGENPLLPVLILLDIRMPRLTGLEVLARVRDDPRTRLVPVVMLTSSTEDADMLESYGLGANSYIRKPVDFDRFVEVAKTVGMYWLLLNEIPRSVSGTL